MRGSASELILNADQSIYHLHLHPEDLADTIITVGDPDRVSMVSRHFDTIEIRKGKREFLTHTGTLNNKHLTVISTGIGTDNIDIVLNELDALANINLETGVVLPKHRQLNVIRLGTSGAIQPEIALDSFLLNEYALGLDGLLHFYGGKNSQYRELEKAFVAHMQWSPLKSVPYVVAADASLRDQLGSDKVLHGCTATNLGFYGPQGRYLRLEPEDGSFIEKLASFEFSGMKITNMEMETSGIYGLCNLLGHRAISINCILANRARGSFSGNPYRAVSRLIAYALEKITTS